MGFFHQLFLVFMLQLTTAEIDRSTPHQDCMVQYVTVEHCRTAEHFPFVYTKILAALSDHLHSCLYPLTEECIGSTWVRTYSAINTDQIPAPFNLTLKSYNFNTTLYWDYNLTYLMPYFQVEILNYNIGKNWTVVQSCKRISQTCCDLSKLITDPKSYYHVRVKSFVGSMESKYAKKNNFCLRIHGIIGPPILAALWEDNKIIVDIAHPLVPFTENEPQTIWKFYDDFEYDVYLTGKNVTYKCDECDEDGCTVYIVPPSKDGTVCVSAEGSSKSWVVVGEKSKEICIQLRDENAEESYKWKNFLIQAFVILCLVIFVGSLIYVITIKIRARDKVPHFLINVMRQRHSCTLMNSNNSPFDNFSTSPIEITGNQISKQEDVLSQKEMSAQPFFQELYDPDYQRAMTETEAQQSEPDQCPINAEPESDNSSSNYYRTENDHKDSGISINSSLHENNKEETPCTDTIPVSNSYGYDKPHVPLDLLIQMNKEVYDTELNSSVNC